MTDREKLWLLSQAILGLTPDELRVLNKMVTEGGGGEPLGVREPREPSPESPGDAIAMEVEEE